MKKQSKPKAHIAPTNPFSKGLNTFVSPYQHLFLNQIKNYRWEPSLHRTIGGMVGNTPNDPLSVAVNRVSKDWGVLIYVEHITAGDYVQLKMYDKILKISNTALVTLGVEELVDIIEKNFKEYRGAIPMAESKPEPKQENKKKPESWADAWFREHSE